MSQGPNDSPNPYQVSDPNQPPQDWKPDEQGSQPQKTSGKAIASFILGLLSFVFCIITAIPAIIFGFLGLGDIKRSRGRLKGNGLAGAGIALGFVGIVFICPVLLLLPAINAAREAARRNGCLSNIRVLALSEMNHEAATKRFPVTNDGPVDVLVAVPGSADSETQAGYSWLVKILPYVEESALYDEIGMATERLRKPAFDGELTDSMGEPFASRQVPTFKCPSFAGGGNAIAPEYAGMSSAPAVANYIGIVGTDLSPGGQGHKARYDNWENGGMASSCYDGSPDCTARGLKIKEIGDGISKTVIIAESVEQAYSAWYDGSTAWGVAVSPSTGTVGAHPGDGFVALVGGDTALNNDPDVVPFLTAGEFGGQQDRGHGFSSHHAGNVVLHAFMDAHAIPISTDIDPTVYLRTLTRSDGDPVDYIGL